MTEPLRIPRRLAIRLLHEAQVHGERACGLLSGNESGPSEIHPLAQGTEVSALLAQLGERVWASYDLGVSRFSFPRRLVISIDTAMDLRGVLKMRCYETVNGQTSERTLSILENT